MLPQENCLGNMISRFSSGEGNLKQALQVSLADAAVIA
jgi:hypothetical protein